MSWLDKAEILLSHLPVKMLNSNRMVPFRWNPNQSTRWQKIRAQWETDKKIRIIDLKSRRVGVSAQTDALAWSMGLAFPLMNMKIVAHLTPSAEELFRVPRDLSMAFPSFPKEDIQSKRIFFRHLGGDSHITLATAGTPSAGRGGTLSLLHMSEAAYFPSDDSFTAMISSVSKGEGSAIVIESTANGVEGPGEAFYDYWQDAVAGKNGYIPCFLGWLSDPTCVRAPLEADDAPQGDLEKELMAKPFNANKSQIAWMRRTLADDCRNLEFKFLQDYPHCLLKNTLVSTLRGMIPIESVVVGDITENGIVSAVLDKGVQPLWHVHTRDGRHIVGTSDHLMIGENGEEIPISECRGKKLQLAAPVFADKHYEVVSTGLCGVVSRVTVDEDMGRFLGYWMGNGSYSNKQASIACFGDDKDVLEDMQFLFQKYFNYAELKPASVGNCMSVRVSRPRFPIFLEMLDIWSDCPPHRRVKVPDCIFRSPKSVVREFIRGLFETDGSIRKDGIASLSAKDRAFLQQVQLLLLGFGITSRINLQKGKKSDGSYDTHTLDLRTKETSLFLKSVGFFGARKNEKVEINSRRGHYRKPLPIEFTDEVTQSRPLGQGHVWDISIRPWTDIKPENKSLFSANGFLVHNCPEVAFQVSGSPAFARDELSYAARCVRDPICHGKFVRDDAGRGKFVEDEKGPWNIWKKPFEQTGKSDGLTYYIGADAALGDQEGDFAAAVVLCGETGEIAARFTERVAPESLADQLDLAGRWYNTAMVNIELTGNLGRWAQIKLRDVFRYPQYKIYHDKRKDDKPRGKSRGISLGFEMSQATRRLIIDATRSMLRMGTRNEPGALVVNDSMCSQQMSICTIKEWRWDVERGHDDALVAMMIACLTREQYPPTRLRYAPKLTGQPTLQERLAEIGMNVRPPQDDTLKKEMNQIMRQSAHRRQLVDMGLAKPGMNTSKKLIQV